ncbi:MAG: phosphodiester glycosidase family protein [Planctomycetes bacterium]|nr:phosphodiester glycosidase family protein [Planctomycetota bacterium]
MTNPSHLAAVLALAALGCGPFAQQLAREETLASELAACAWRVREVGEGVTWSRCFARLFAAPQCLNVLRIAPARATTPRALRVAAPEPFARVPTSTLAREQDALAAVNGGFFDTKTGAPDGLLVVDGVLRADGRGSSRAFAFVVGRDARPAITRVDAIEADTLATALAAGPRLLHAGRPTAGPRTTDPRHPRTALGLCRDRSLLLLTADGRDERAAGLSLDELTAVLQALGCVEALNLDGGGSTTMWLAQDGIVNHPCDDRRFDHAGERGVANALLVCAPLVIELDEDDATLHPPASWQTVPTRGALDGDAARSEDRDARARFVLRPARPGRYALELRVQDATPTTWQVVVDGRAPAQLRATAGARTLALGEYAIADAGQTLAVELTAHGDAPLVVDALRATECAPPERR